MYIRKDGTALLTINVNDKINEKIQASKKKPIDILNKELDVVIEKKKEKENLTNSICK